MKTKPKRITCSSCGRRRAPFIGSRGRPTKTCGECMGRRFWTSSFGEWFLGAAARQCPKSMPLDDEDIIEIYGIWKARKAAQGTRFRAPQIEGVWIYDDFGEAPSYTLEEVKEGAWFKAHAYELAHLAPVKGEGYRGRLTSKNLIVAPREVNRQMSNTPTGHTEHQIKTSEPPFKSKATAKLWAAQTYNLKGIAERLKLKPKARRSPSRDLSVGTPVAPSEMFVKEVSRLGWAMKHEIVSDAAGAYITLLRGSGKEVPWVDAVLGRMKPPEPPEEDF